MYTEYFGFKEAPFSIAPDPHYLYMTTQHRDALAHLVYGMNSDGGCILLTGEVGTGKTTICRCLLEQIPDQANVALLLNPKVSEVELLETVCDELKIEYPDTQNSIKTYTDRIYNYLIQSNRNNEKTVLIIDEAQNLSSPVLEQLRLLTNLETDERKLLQIIILGQPELLDILAKPEMRQLAQRITARFHLKPLTRGEVKAYVNHRLAIAGQNVQLFPEKSIRLLYRLSNGIPRLINIICDRALLGAYVENQHTVHPGIIKKAAVEVFGELKNLENKQKHGRWMRPVPAIVITLIGVSALITTLYDSSSGIHEASQAIIQTPDTGATLPLAKSAAIEEPTLTTEDDNIETQPINSRLDAGDTSDAADSTATTEAEAQDTVAQSKSTDADIEAILNDTSNNSGTAFEALFSLWNYQYDKTSTQTACKQAEAHSLSCLFKQGNLNNLRTHNRPAVLKLISSTGDDRYITISSIEGDSAMIYANNIPLRISLDDIDRYWFGQFTLLWQKPDDYQSAITPGDSGTIVTWLNGHFNLTDDTMTGQTYDDKLLHKVKQFQVTHGLAADGIVGPVTILYINADADFSIPTLSRPG